MAFVHSTNTEVFCNGYDLTAYLDTISCAGSASTAKTTTFGKNENTYIAGTKDATLASEGFFDGVADAVDEVFNSALATDSVEWCWYPDTDAVGKTGFAIEGVNNAHGVSSTIDEACRVSASAQASTGLERILSLHAMGAESESDWTGTGQDNAEATTNGGSAYIQVTGASGTIEVKIEHATQSNFSDKADLVSFTAVTGRTSERVTFSGTVNRYVRGFATIAGGENITFNLAICRL